MTETMVKDVEAAEVVMQEAADLLREVMADNENMKRMLRDDCKCASFEMCKSSGQTLTDKLTTAQAEAARLREALIYVSLGLSLAYDAVEKMCYDEAMLHIGHHSAKAREALKE